MKLRSHAHANIGVRFNHENDNDDIPEGQNPIGFVQLKNKNKH